MTPDERLREAVKLYMSAACCVPLCGTPDQNRAVEVAAKALVDAYNDAHQAALVANSRPCINAAVEVEKDRSWFGWFQRWRKKR